MKHKMITMGILSLIGMSAMATAATTATHTVRVTAPDQLNITAMPQTSVEKSTLKVDKAIGGFNITSINSKKVIVKPESAEYMSATKGTQYKGPQNSRLDVKTDMTKWDWNKSTGEYTSKQPGTTFSFPTVLSLAPAANLPVGDYVLKMTVRTATN
ncbi:hypothetical protein A9798_12425 [Edwardsiella hoshinae]|uniref:Uncharacterized protein n=1 Tax=Edwardsiella hoshinae TaxID=93378 RepID=A0ABN4SYP2_9GAMM|nr:hypothetical protein [Edwardsiella hoshinae]AOV97675.1 hypothetical protein A9798_12425 [Edwardsiella hoshinae]